MPDMSDDAIQKMFQRDGYTPLGAQPNPQVSPVSSARQQPEEPDDIGTTADAGRGLLKSGAGTAVAIPRLVNEGISYFKPQLGQRLSDLAESAPSVQSLETFADSPNKTWAESAGYWGGEAFQLLPGGFLKAGSKLIDLAKWATRGGKAAEAVKGAEVAGAATQAGARTAVPLVGKAAEPAAAAGPWGPVPPAPGPWGPIPTAAQEARMVTTGPPPEPMSPWQTGSHLDNMPKQGPPVKVKPPTYEGPVFDVKNPRSFKMFEHTPIEDRGPVKAAETAKTAAKPAPDSDNLKILRARHAQEAHDAKMRQAEELHQAKLGKYRTAPANPAVPATPATPATTPMTGGQRAAQIGGIATRGVLKGGTAGAITNPQDPGTGAMAGAGFGLAGPAAGAFAQSAAGQYMSGLMARGLAAHAAAKIVSRVTGLPIDWLLSFGVPQSIERYHAPVGSFIDQLARQYAGRGGSALQRIGPWTWGGVGGTASNVLNNQ